MVHFDLDDRYLDDNVVGSAISRRDGVFLSLVVHALIAAGIVYGPELQLFHMSPDEAEQRARTEQREDERTFVFVEPQVDLRALRPRERAPLSDEDRIAQAPEPAPKPENPDPPAQGNSPERVDREASERADDAEERVARPDTQIARAEPPLSLPGSTPPAGSLGEALRNLQRYVQNETFNNPQGGNDRPGATIQFDTQGVEFGPWLRRFVAQVRRNWFIPQSAMVMSGNVVLQFNIHRNGQITDVVVMRPSPIESFNNASFGAIVSSNPTEPLPPEYPLDKVLFTVTFYYNEQPPVP